jgi:hypothetical protein
VTLEYVATELEQAMRELSGVSLTLQEAARESGYSADHLRHLVATGTIPNAGRRGRPRVRRGDVPTRPGNPHPPAYDAAADALRVVRNAG